MAPAVTVAEPEPPAAGPSPRLGLAPVPVKLSVWGLPEALSAIVSVPVRVPAADGVKKTEIAQLPPAAT